MVDKDDTITGDFCMMEEISETAMFNKLQDRFMQDKIYTNIGEVVVSVNPYKKIPSLYSDDCVRQFKDKQMFECPPHIYAISNDIYWNLLKNKENQCVIISGESGAGKTEASKILLKYLSEVSKKADEVSRIAKMLVESNPILEAFGNAKTLRNDNSSRFGKYMDIEFDIEGSPIGGKVTNYLLEKARLTGREKNERCFHIFYQLLAGLPEQELKELGLSRDPSQYEFLRRSDCYKVDSINDADDFTLMRRALDTLGFPKEDQQALWKVIAAILHLGNLTFNSISTGSEIVEHDLATKVSSLLGVNTDELKKVLTHKTIVTGSGTKQEQLTSGLEVNEAGLSRDSLVKSIYQRTFDWLVETINVKIGRKDSSKSLVVGVLDIYGFEVFPNNGFEQFCINLCNEKLQQIFIEVVLKREQDTYVREGIEWTPVQYFNNRIICELLEGPPKTSAKEISKSGEVGLIPLMDELGFVKDSTDNQLLDRLNNMYKGHKHFKSAATTKDTKMKRNQFVIEHYAGNVDYNIEGFLEKNKDTVFKDLRICMATSSNGIIKAKYPPVDLEQEKKRPVTAGTQFKGSLALLMDTLFSCDAHYIRCIKPNETKSPQKIDEERVLHQLRYLGLMENVRVRRAGFAFKRPYSFFLWRYKAIGKDTWPLCKRSPAEDAESILKQFNIGKDEYRLGKSMIFIRSPKTLVTLEEARNQKLPEIATLIQKNYRRAVLRKKYKQYKAAQLLQAVILGRNAREVRLVFQPATLLIQKLWKVYQVRPYVQKLESAAEGLNESKDLGRDFKFPSAPAILDEPVQHAKRLFKLWRFKTMTKDLSKERQEKIKTKITTFEIFSGNKPYDISRIFGNCDFIARSQDQGLATKFTTNTQKDLNNPKKNTQGDSKILFSDFCTLISPKYKPEKKALVVMNKNIWFLDPKSFSRPKECLPGADITGIQMTQNKGEQYIVLQRASPAPDFVFEVAITERSRETLSELVTLLITHFGLSKKIVSFPKALTFNLTRTAKKPAGEDCTCNFSQTTDPKLLKIKDDIAFKSGKKGQHNIYFRG